jgi:beta-phosphoglucomutase-like phosphatase (HAD superfamily)
MAENIGFVFDLDGTVINSTEIGNIIKKEVYNKFNIHTNEKIEKEIEDLTYKIMQDQNRKNLGAKLMWELFKLVGLSFIQRIRALRLAQKIFKKEIPNIKLIDGTEELFNFLDDQSFKYSIATTSSEKEIYDRLKKYPKLYQKLDGKIISRNAVKQLKPHPESLQKAAKIMGVPLRNCIVIGDMHTDILMGKNGNATTIGVLTGVFSYEKFLKFNPDFIFNSINDIITNIDQIKEKVKNKTY